MAERTIDTRQERIESAMREFYNRPVPEQVISWHSKKLAQEKKPSGQCVICKSLNIPIGLSGIGATFQKHPDGRLTAVCGGRDDKPVCPGYSIMRDTYVDQATITSEIREAMRYMRRELKLIRDRVLATEELTRQDEKEFREMTGEYIRLKQIEDAHKDVIEDLLEEHVSSFIEEDDILVPEAFFGSTDSRVLTTPMLPTEKKSGTLEVGEYPEMKVFTIRREDIPVLLRIDEPTDDE